MATIEIKQAFNKEDLKCIVCLDYLNKQIFQCSNGPHYACGKCNIELKLCPVCRHEGPLVRMITLEQELKKHLVKCEYNHVGCQEMIFGWDKGHKQSCKYRPIKCLFCDKEVTCNCSHFLGHLTNGGCKIQFEGIKHELKKPKFKCTLRENNAPTYVDVKDRYIIIILPQVKNEKYMILVLSLNDNLINKKLKCTIKSGNVDHDMYLPIIDIQNYSYGFGYLSFPINNLHFDFEDVNFKPLEQSLNNQTNNLLNTMRNYPSGNINPSYSTLGQNQNPMYLFENLFGRNSSYSGYFNSDH